MEVPIIAPSAPSPQIIAYPDPGDIPPAGFQVLKNVRVRNATLTVRGGVYEDTTAPVIIGLPSDAQFLGGGQTEYGLFRAFGSASEGQTRIYLGSTEVSASSGQWGVTRFPRADAPVSFFQVRHLDKTYVIVTNGIDDARVYDGEVLTIHHAEIVPPIQKAPTATSGRAKVIFGVASAIKTNGSITFSHSNQGILAEKVSPSAGNEYLRLRVTATAQNGGNATMNFGAQYTGDGGGFPLNNQRHRQLILVVNSLATVSPIVFWDQVKVELISKPPASQAYVIYDPNNLAKGRIMYPANDLATYWILAFPLDDVPNGLYDRLRFTWVGATRNSGPEYQMGLFLVAFSGREMGGTSYGVTYAHERSGSESPGVLYPPAEGEDIDILDGSVNNGRTAIKLPVYQGIYYWARIVVQNPSNSLRDEGVSKVIVYARPPRGSYYTKKATIRLASYSAGSWSWEKGNAGDYVVGEIDSSWAIIDEDPLNRIPDAFHLSIPKGYVLTGSGSRLLVASGSDLYISEDKNPFRFRHAIRFLDENDPDMLSPVKISFAGEKVLGAVLLPSAEGQERFLIFTDKNLYQIEGSDSWTLGRPSLIENVGLRGRREFARYRGEVLFSDTENQLRLVGKQVVSRYRVDNLLNPPSLTSADRTMMVTDERFYLTIPELSTPGNERVLVYNIFRDVFESLDSWPVRPYKQIDLKKFLGTDGKVYHFEGGSRDKGNQLINVQIKTRRFTNGYVEPVYVGAIKLLSDGPVSGGSVTYRGYPSGNVLNSSLPSSTTLKWLANYSTDTSPGLADLAVELDISGNYEPGAQILGLSAVVETREVEASVG